MPPESGDRRRARRPGFRSRYTLRSIRCARQRERLSAMKQYIVGIDLGTSNTVVAYVRADADEIRVFDIDQLVGIGDVPADL